MTLIQQLSQRRGRPIAIQSSFGFLQDSFCNKIAPQRMADSQLVFRGVRLTRCMTAASNRARIDSLALVFIVNNSFLRERVQPRDSGCQFGHVELGMGCVVAQGTSMDDVVQGRGWGGLGECKLVGHDGDLELTQESLLKRA